MEAKDDIELSIIICTYNRNEYLPETLKHISNQDISFARIEVLIIDNNSTDGTSKTCEEFIANHQEVNTHYFLENQQGLSFARNRGIQEARGKILAFIDDDAFVDQPFSKNLLAFFNEHHDAVACGGKIIPNYEESEPAWMTKHLLPLVAAVDLGQAVTKYNGRKFPLGANMAFRKEILDEVGLFDTDLGRRGDQLESGEEKDLFLRISKLGHPIYYVGNVVVQHVIPPKRTTLEYIQKMAKGVGKSEKLRVRKMGSMAVLKKIFEEIYKSIGTVALALYYLVTNFSWPKAMMLVKFRFWVIRSLLK